MPDELKQIIPILLPMTHTVEGLPGITKYPIGEWIRTGQFVMTEESWCKLCMQIADADMANLYTVFQTADTLSGNTIFRHCPHPL
jgi:hypothetical protein